MAAVSIVRPGGSPLALPLRRGLEERLGARNVLLIRAEELRERIGVLAPVRAEVSQDLAAARAFELEARFEEAAGRYLRARDRLARDPRTQADPRQIAEVELNRGAVLVASGQEAAAVEILRASLGWVEGLQADATFSPEVRRTLEEARRLGALAPEPPEPAATLEVLEAAEASFFVFVALEGREGARVLRSIVTDRSGRRLLHETRPFGAASLGAIADRAAARITQAIWQEVPAPPEPRPLWLHPLVLGGAGLVVAASIVTVLFLTAQETVTPRLQL